MLIGLKRWVQGIWFRLIAHWLRVDHLYIRRAFNYLAQLDMQNSAYFSGRDSDLISLYGCGNHVEIDCGTIGRFTLNENDRGEIFIHEYMKDPRYVSQGDANFTPKTNWKEIYRSNHHITEPLAVHRALAAIRKVYAGGEQHAV